MKTCWQVLGIEATTDTDAIRQAYLALLPSFHPETDPQGFKQLREAYENALQGTTSPAITVVDEDPDTPWVNYLREIFGDLLADGERRFQPQAWQEFIQQINKLSISQVEKSRWWLCAIAMKTFPISYSCLKLLSDRLAWEQGSDNRDVDAEEVEDLLFEIRRGDLFDYSLLLHLPVAVQNQTIAFYDALDNTFFRASSLFRPTYGPARRLDYPGQSTLSTTSVTLVQHLALGYCGAAASRPGMAGSRTR